MERPRKHPVDDTAAAETKPRKRLKNLAIEREPVRASLRDNGDGEFEWQPYVERSPLEIPQDILKDLENEGWKLQWIAVSVLGKPEHRRMSMFQTGGWERVKFGDWNGLLDSLFGNGSKGLPIEYEGCALVARPMFIHDKAKRYERAAAIEPLERARRLISGGVDVAMPGGGNHPTAIKSNRLRQTVERLPVPEE